MAQYLLPSITTFKITVKQALQEGNLLLDHLTHIGLAELRLSATKGNNMI